MRIRSVSIIASIIVLIGLVLIVGGGIALIGYAIDDTPRVFSRVALTPRDIARAKLLKEKYDPRTLRDRDIARIDIDERDLNILLGYAVDRFRRANPMFSMASRMDSEMRILRETAEWVVTIGLPETLFGKFINIGVGLVETQQKPSVSRISIGRIGLSGQWIAPVLSLANHWVQQVGGAQEVATALALIKRVWFKPHTLTVVYEWRPEAAQQLAEKGRSLLVTDQDVNRLAAYTDQIGLTTDRITAKTASLADFIGPVFQLAQRRSETTGEASAENRAAILALTLFANQRDMGPLVGNSPGKSVKKPKDIEPTLHGRTDLPKHFLISAALTVLADSQLSDMAGLFKEIDDSMAGSGFSFIDLLADRAGVRFAELATADERSAVRVQRTLAGAGPETVFMPPIGGLPEGLMQKTFTRRYRDMESAAYQGEKQEIERRIDGCPLFRKP